MPSASATQAEVPISTSLLLVDKHAVQQPSKLLLTTFSWNASCRTKADCQGATR